MEWRIKTTWTWSDFKKKYLLKVNTYLLLKNKTKPSEKEGKETQGSSSTRLRLLPKIPFRHNPWRPGKSRPPSPTKMQQSPWGSGQPNKSLWLKDWKERDNKSVTFLQTILSPEKGKSQGNQKTRKRFSKPISFQISKQNQLSSSTPQSSIRKKKKKSLF